MEQRNGRSEGDEGALEARIHRMVDRTAELGGEDELRREALVERAEARGVRRTTAEQAYDLALQEGLKPAWALAAVIEGVSVQPLRGTRPDVRTTEPTEPEWVDAAPDTRSADRELRLRQTFRRLRTRLEEADDVRGAIDALCDDPDLEAHAFDR